MKASKILWNASMCMEILMNFSYHWNIQAKFLCLEFKPHFLKFLLDTFCQNASMCMKYLDGLIWSLKHRRWTGILKIQALFPEILFRDFLSKCIYVHEIFQCNYLITSTFKINWYNWNSRLISWNSYQTSFCQNASMCIKIWTNLLNY